MDYTIAEATLNDVPTIVEVTMQSFQDAFQKPFYLSREDAIHRWTAYMRKKHGWLVWDNFLNLLNQKK